MNSQPKMASKNKRCQNNTKNLFTTSVNRPLKSNCSSDSREDHSANNRISKQKMTKQPSQSQLRSPLYQIDVKYSPSLIHNREMAEINKENASRQMGPSRTINKCVIQKRSEYQSQMMCETSQFTRHEEANYRPNSSNTGKNFRQEYQMKKSEGVYKKSNFQSHQRNNMFRCGTPGCNMAIAYYAERPNRQQFIYCNKCAQKKKLEGLDLRDIKQLISKKNPQVKELWDKMNYANDNIMKVLNNLQNHKKSLLSEVQYQLYQHNMYYDSMCEIIQRKKEDTRKLFEERMRMLDNEFKTLRNKVFSKRCEVESLYKDASIFIDFSASQLSQETKNYIAKLTASIPSENDYALYETESWKVEIDDLKLFQKDVDKYLIRVVSEADIQEEKMPISKDDGEYIEEQNQSLDQLMCDQELEWGVKTKVKETHPKVNEMYFSFQKHNSIIYQNAEEHISSPGFKQI